MPSKIGSGGFTRLLASAGSKEILSPLLRAYLFNPDFPEFEVKVDSWKSRPPDGYFHPSTHPSWTERMLYYYLTQPDLMLAEPFQINDVMAILQGNIWHVFIQKCLMEMGVLTGVEVEVEDPETRARGSMDGLTNPDKLPIDEPEVWEFKCLAPEVRVSLAGGGWKRAGAVVVGDEVLGWTEDGLTPGRVVETFDNGVRPIYLVQTKQGREIGVTEEHPFLTDEGWVKARHLEPGMKLKVAGRYNPQPQVALSPDRAWFLGAMVGDGGCTQSEIRFSNADPLVLSAMDWVVAEFGCRLMRRGTGVDWAINQGPGVKTRNRVKAYLREVGMVQGSHGKSIPDVVWLGGAGAWIDFLSGYFDTDGRVAPSPYPQILWTSINRDLLRECQTMLLYLGVRSSVVRVQANGVVSWRLHVRDVHSVRTAQSILRLRGEKAESLAALKPRSPKSGHHAIALQDWDLVRSVTVEEARSTVALTVAGHHTHVTEGLVTHNTMHPRKLSKLAKGAPDSEEVVESFKADNWEYYLQGQEYMRLSGYTRWRGLILGLVNPFPMREVVMEYDQALGATIAARYRSVLDHVEHDQPPQPCCAPRSKEADACPARQTCPVGML